MRRKTENMEFGSVAIGFKHAVRSPETLADSAGQIETERLSDIRSEYRRMAPVSDTRTTFQYRFAPERSTTGITTLSSSPE